MIISFLKRNIFTALLRNDVSTLGHVRWKDAVEDIFDVDYSRIVFSGEPLINTGRSKKRHDHYLTGKALC